MLKWITFRIKFRKLKMCMILFCIYLVSLILVNKYLCTDKHKHREPKTGPTTDLIRNINLDGIKKENIDLESTENAIGQRYKERFETNRNTLDKAMTQPELVRSERNVLKRNSDLKIQIMNTESRNQTRFMVKELTHNSPMNFKNYPASAKTKFLKLDLKLYRQPTFLQNVKNPCYYQSQLIKGQKRRRRQFVCVPYFMIAGFPKCGTTDLWYRLLQHPEITTKHRKEINFFHKTLFRDGSVDTAYNTSFWRELPGNVGCQEPVVTLAHYVHKVNPKMKIIFMLRNPTERLYSDYLFEAGPIGYQATPELFHETVLETISDFNRCQRVYSTRRCVYDTVMESDKVRLRAGMYSTFVADWMNVFGREQVLVVKSEDTLVDQRLHILNNVFDFLQIGRLNKSVLETVYGEMPKNVQKYKKPMLRKTRKILQNFYKPFNEELVNMLSHIVY